MIDTTSGNLTLDSASGTTTINDDVVVSGQLTVEGNTLIHSQGIISLDLLWMKIKLGLVTILTAYHFYLLAVLKDFQADNNTKSSKFFRIIKCQGSSWFQLMALQPLQQTPLLKRTNLLVLSF